MMSRDHTPLRAMASYATAARVLNGAAYVGDLAPAANQNSVRVFARGDEAVLVLYMTSIDPAATATVGVPVSRVAGADGRELRPGAAGQLPVPDGLGYAWARRADVEPLLRTDSAARRLYAVGRAPPPRRPPAAAVVLSHPLGDEAAQVTYRKYLLDETAARSAVVHARASNLSTRPQHVTLELHLPGGPPAASPEPTSVDLAPLASADVRWPVDLSRSLDVSEVRYVDVVGHTGDGGRLLPVAIPYLMEGTIEQLVARQTYRQPLPVHDLNRWVPNVSGNGRLSFTLADGGATRLRVTFAPMVDPWCFPIFRLPNQIDVGRARGLVLRGRVRRAAVGVDLMLQESPSKPGFWMTEVLPADDAWHAVYLPFSDFTVMPGNPDMQNAVFDPSKVTTMELGFVSRTGENEMDVSDLVVVGR